MSQLNYIENSRLEIILLERFKDNLQFLSDFSVLEKYEVILIPDTLYVNCFCLYLSLFVSLNLEACQLYSL